MSEPGTSRPKRAKIVFKDPNELTEEELLQALLYSDDSEDEVAYESDDWYDASKADLNGSDSESDDQNGK